MKACEQVVLRWTMKRLSVNGNSYVGLDMMEPIDNLKIHQLMESTTEQQLPTPENAPAPNTQSTSSSYINTDRLPGARRGTTPSHKRPKSKQLHNQSIRRFSDQVSDQHWPLIPQWRETQPTPSALERALSKIPAECRHPTTDDITPFQQHFRIIDDYCQRACSPDALTYPKDVDGK